MNQEEAQCVFCGDTKPVNRIYVRIKNKHFNNNEKGQYSDFFYYCNDCGIEVDSN